MPFEELGRSLKTTNCIEIPNEKVEGYTSNVKRWHHSSQRQRWMAQSLLGAESGRRHLTRYRDFPKLKKALKETTLEREGYLGEGPFPLFHNEVCIYALEK